MVHLGEGRLPFFGNYLTSLYLTILEFFCRNDTEQGQAKLSYRRVNKIKRFW